MSYQPVGYFYRHNPNEIGSFSFSYPIGDGVHDVTPLFKEYPLNDLSKDDKSYDRFRELYHESGKPFDANQARSLINRLRYAMADAINWRYETELALTLEQNMRKERKERKECDDLNAELRAEIATLKDAIIVYQEIRPTETAQLDAEVERLTKVVDDRDNTIKMIEREHVPINNARSAVFINGAGDVRLDYGDKLLKRAEAAEKLVEDLEFELKHLRISSSELNTYTKKLEGSVEEQLVDLQSRMERLEQLNVGNQTFGGDTLGQPLPGVFSSLGKDKGGYLG